MARLNLSLLGAATFSLLAWALVAEGGYRLTHDGKPGLRHALYAHAVQLVRTAESEV